MPPSVRSALVKLIVILLFAAIVVSLGMALKGLFRRDHESPDRMIRALTVRIGLSVLAFLLLLLAWYTGLITPHGVAP
jgi:hypothetical protein